MGMRPQPNTFLNPPVKTVNDGCSDNHMEINLPETTTGNTGPNFNPTLTLTLSHVSVSMGFSTGYLRAL